MSSDGPTQMADAPRTGEWLQRPWLARAVRGVVAIAPVSISFVLTRALAHTFTPASLHMNRWLWLACLAVVSTNLLVLVDRIARRLLPLAALLKLALVFPDEAPSRFGVALRSSTTRSLERRLASLTDGALDGPDDVSGYMTAMLEMVGALSRHERLTRGHVERVRAYTDLIIGEMGLSADEANKLRWASLLHDVGKLRVPAEILAKKGRPTDDEWELLKTHPAQGELMVEPLAAWLGDWRHAVGQHHERWDGGGYPRGLAGNEIHLSGRIVAVADAYDVMTSTRSYKRAMSPTVARAEIARCAGTQFDPVVVRAFLNVSVRHLRWMLGPLSWLPNLPLGLANTAAPAASPVFTGLAALSAAAAGTIGTFEAATFDAALGDAPAAARVEITAAPAPAAGDPASAPTTGGAGTAATPGTSTSTTTTTAAGGAPRAAVADASTAEDEPVRVVLRASSPTAPLTFTLAAPPAHGSVAVGAVAADGREWAAPAVYTPDQDFNGSDSFIFRACDDEQHCATATVNLTITPVNDAPVPQPKSLAVLRGGSARLPIATLVAGATDVEGDAVSFVSIGSATKGTVAVSGADIVYTATVGAAGTDTVPFTLRDAPGATATGTLTVTISGAPPAAVDDSLSVVAGAVSRLAVEANDVDPDGGTLRVVAATVASGTVTITDGRLFYQPANGFTGQTTGTYTVEDGDGLQASARFSVSVGSPVAMYSGPTHGVGEDTLDGAVLWGTVWIYLETRWTGAQIAAVDFSIDGGPVRRDTTWIFDATASALDTTTLANGVHTLRAVITLTGGSVITRQFAFTVAN